MNQISIAKIRAGTVLDHIEAGSAHKIYEILCLKNHPETITLGIRLPSKKMGQKDLLKIEGRSFSPEELSSISLFAPQATISIIENGKIVKKYKIPLPDEIQGLFSCPNVKCISHKEELLNRFKVYHRFKETLLECNYCQGSFNVSRAVF